MSDAYRNPYSVIILMSIIFPPTVNLVCGYSHTKKNAGLSELNPNINTWLIFKAIFSHILISVIELIVEKL